MIEHYLAASRRTRPPTAAITAVYEKYYEWIVARTTPIGQSPELFITYSSDRKSELIRIGQTTYLVYDQYLGQSFNRLNRIQYALHGAPMLSQAYACKYVAERLLCLGLTGPAAFFALASRQFVENVKADGNPFKLPMKVEAIRLELTASQELFVMAHELAHHHWQLDRGNRSEEITHYIEEFLDHKVKSTDGDNYNAVDHYRKALDRAPTGFHEEVFADDFGAMIAFSVASINGVPAWQSVAGAILAFKYLRLFRHLELLANCVAELSSEPNPESFKRRFTNLKNDIWDAQTGNIRLFQFREHFIRHRLWLACGRMPSYDPGDEVKISSLIGEYDEKTEFPVVLGLIDRLEDSLTPEILAKLTEKMVVDNDGVAFVDRLTGWSR
ncbi:hypothetical protein [Chromobacterium violaceum]|uniref:hypothetical protein n=1 Tax=Chromobacterium violaceum TaxID=536 RepID=UPI0005D40403|nr:hypothetical protein [Chromobacterium violaceum]KJH65677.1 hypothetical protein UF16_20415 [Chromobacterium violaceum]